MFISYQLCASGALGYLSPFVFSLSCFFCFAWDVKSVGGVKNLFQRLESSIENLKTNA
jgi:hypothetical protein